MTSPGGELRVYPDRLVRNARVLLDALGPNLIAVVKGDGYGLGLVTCARAFADAGITALAVADIDEAIAVRAAGIATRILVLQPQQIAPLPALSLEWVLGQIEVGRLLASPPDNEATTLIHLEVDLGVGRGGIAPQHAEAALHALRATRGVRVVGLAGHLPSHPDRQRVSAAVAVLERLRAHVPDATVHIGGSDALPWRHLASCAWLRVGRALYGIVPRDLARPEFGELTYPWAWIADATPFVPPASGGYTATRRPRGTPCRINAGYAHGLPVQAAGHWPVLVDGRRYLIHDVFMLSSVAYPYDKETTADPAEALLSGEAAHRLPVRDVSGSIGVPTTAILLAPRSPKTVAAP